MINLVFFFFLFQYLLLQGDMHRFMRAFVTAIASVSLYALIREFPFDPEKVRLGIAANVNPNWLGMLAAVAAGFCLVLARKKRALWLLPLLVLLPVAVLSKSAKALALAALLLVAFYLILHPKRWWLKLAVLCVAGIAALYFLVFLDSPLSNGILHRQHVMLHYLADGSANADSIIARDSLMDVAMKFSRQRPLTGFGLGCFQFLDDMGTYSHNNFTELLVSGGAVLVALYYLPQLLALALSARASANNRRTGGVRCGRCPACWHRDICRAAHGADRHGLRHGFVFRPHRGDLFRTARRGGQDWAKPRVRDGGRLVERLDAAGAVPLGKLNMHELAYGITSANPHFGAVRNPWDARRTPGGSSGGSGAAVADGMVFMAMGSDTGGSIRIPASFCGVVGLKPTYGRVSRFGALPLSWSLDHMGPLARSVRDAALVLNALAGRDPRDPASSRRPAEDYVPDEGCAVRGLRVGVADNFYFETLDPEVDLAVRGALARARSLGAEVMPVRVPDIAALNAVARVILLAEASAVMEPHLARREQFGADVLALFDQGRLLSATDYIHAQRLRRRLRLEFQRVWAEVDCLIVPATPNTAPRLGDATVRLGDAVEDVRLASTRLVRGFNALGFPALSMPCGLSLAGLPIGLQIVGPAFGEAAVLRLGAALEDDGLTVPRPPE